MIVLGAGHRAQQGKSSFCSAIAEQCDRIGIKWKEYSISDSILEYAIASGRLPEIGRSECTDEQVKVLVEIGNEKRAEAETFWVDQIRKAIEEDRPEFALIPNVRFASEAKFVKEVGGYNVRVRRLNPNGTRFVSSSRNPNDVTETALEFWNWDFEIVNMSGRSYWLRRQAIALFDYLRDGLE